ncbi:AAA family ATPase [Advenella incenata]
MIEPSVPHGTEPAQQLDSEYTDHNELPPTQATQGSDQYPRDTDSANAAPVAAQPEQWGNIPTALRERRQWCVAGHSKRPLTANGNLASSTDPDTWTDFDTVCKAARAKGLGIGYMLCADDPFTCIDLDIKDTTPAEHIERFQSIVTTFNSYAEYSRSGKGMHVWNEGKIGKGRKRDGVEVYSQERFIICTGNIRLDRGIAKNQELLENLVSRMPSSANVEIQFDGEEIPDFALAARAAADTGELGRLFSGVWEGRYPSQSDADLALVKLLIPHTDSPNECWQTFRLSELGKREKATRPDYKKSTLACAMQHLAVNALKIQHGQQIANNLFWKDTSHHFRLLDDDDLQNIPPQRWLVKGIIPDGSIGTIFGQSGTYKSFIALDLMAHIANGWPWFGKRVKAAPAVYIPFEGQGGIPKRVIAWRMSRNTKTNIRFITDRMNLRLQADRDKLVSTLTESGWAGGVLCIDTLAQAGAGIDENSSEGMGEMISIFQELQNRLGGTILVIHHSGKVESAGMRGWSGLRGALDFSIKCWRDDNWKQLDAQFLLDKVKDDESGSTFDFSMSVTHIDVDEDGYDITSLTVIPTLKRTTAPDGALAENDAEFVDGWIRKLVAGGRRPTGRELEAMRPKAEYNLSQARLRNAIEGLRKSGRLQQETGGPSGAKWLRPVDTPQVLLG